MSGSAKQQSPGFNVNPPPEITTPSLHTRNAAANEFTFVKRNTGNASPPIVIVNKNSNAASATQAAANSQLFKDVVNSDKSNGQNDGATNG